MARTTPPIPAARGVRTTEDRSARLAVTVFPLLILTAGVLGYVFAPVAAGLGPAVTPLLGIVMFGMGLTLTPTDFRLVASRPLPVLIGVVAQFGVMPLLGLGIAMMLNLEPALAAGLILVGCAPGGTSSNVIAYLSKADTALSVAMTTVSTLLAPLLTPLLVLWLAGTYLEVDGMSMAFSILQVVLVPVIAGLLVRLLLPRVVERVLPALPWVSVAAISLIVAAVVGGSADRVISAGLIVFVAVVLHNGLGYLLGYGLARLVRRDQRTARTTAIEVGMQNSGLAASLATTYMEPGAALPAAVFSLWHNISGGLLAAWFRRRAEAAGPAGQEGHADAGTA
ncbi:bile acid:sodium symporter family protein [Mobilicoccus caccae]|uniref:Na+-dependent transporter n=1 Tax=Mobilicoccus caccae TaxID=1859295 RepID=A0ABQ6IUI3_9MICO|nr:bile acid:sodium symporter family protein [Mobilicoccus caccae]GMA41574.1 Na+-dependent transporter [Mobilicoccus caccae]